MGERTIKGKPILSVMEELTAPIPENKDYWGYIDGRPAYLKVEACEARFNEVLGCFFYSRTAGEPKIRELSGQVCVEVNVTVEIYDDDGKVVVRRSANGANVTGNGDYKSNVASAESEGFKQLCLDMGIGTSQQKNHGFVSKKEKIDEAKKNSSQATYERAEPQAGYQDAGGTDIPKGSTYVKARLQSCFSGNGAFVSANGIDEAGRNVIIKVFRNKFQELSKALGSDFEAFARNLSSGTVVTFTGEYKWYDGKLQVNVWGLA